MGNKNKKERKPRIFFDMDGVLNVWELGTHIDIVAAPGYMRQRTPIESIVAASKILHLCGYECWIASAVLPFEHSIPDKNYWVERHCPWFEENRRIYIPYGSNKASKMQRKILPGDVFLDDYTQNLLDLRKTFNTDLECIKVLNGINDSKHTWNGKRISIYSEPTEIAESIIAFSDHAKEWYETADLC